MRLMVYPASNEISSFARYREMLKDKLIPTVMQAGKYDGSQYILPVFYRIPRGRLSREVEQSQLPIGLNHLLRNGADDVKAAYAENFASVGFRGMFFGIIVDNEREELLISRDELFQRTKEAILLYQDLAKADSTPFDQRDMALWFDYMWGNFRGEDPEQSTYFVSRNAQGGVTASIETWCAVNKNTHYPDDAFYIIDILMSDQFQKMEGLVNNERNYSISRNLTSMFWLSSIGGLPVYSDIGRKHSYHKTTIYTDMSDAIKVGQERIDTVFFTSNIDREIDNMFHELIEKLEENQELDDGTIRQRTDRCWTTLQMMLAEA